MRSPLLPRQFVHIPMATFVSSRCAPRRAGPLCAMEKPPPLVKTSSPPTTRPKPPKPGPNQLMPKGRNVAERMFSAGGISQMRLYDGYQARLVAAAAKRSGLDALVRDAEELGHLIETARAHEGSTGALSHSSVTRFLEVVAWGYADQSQVKGADYDRYAVVGGLWQSLEGV